MSGFNKLVWDDGVAYGEGNLWLYRITVGTHSATPEYPTKLSLYASGAKIWERTYDNVYTAKARADEHMDDLVHLMKDAPEGVDIGEVLFEAIHNPFGYPRYSSEP